MSKESTAKVMLRNDEKLNYIFRPAKNIERKMLCEILSRLSSWSNVSDYQYIGFGSTYFVDFILFHKVLGIQKLISIEKEADMEDRVNFNKPYSCIDIIMGASSDVLPSITWDNKSILWVDYTSSLEGYMFNDMATFFNRAISGSVFVISVNVDLKDEDVILENGKKAPPTSIHSRIQKKLKHDLEVNRRIPESLYKETLKREDYYSIIRNLINTEIEEILSNRNKLETDKKYNYRQFFNIIYRDGAAMLTVGGILFEEKDRQKISSMGLKNLDFVRKDGEYFEISFPNITFREMYAIDKYLPNFNSDEPTKKKALKELKNVISNDAIENYAKLYRYFPTFAEANI